MAERVRTSSPSHVEGKEIVAKLNAALTDVGVYTSTTADSGFHRVRVDMTYSTARRLIELLGSRDA